MPWKHSMVTMGSLLTKGAVSLVVRIALCVYLYSIQMVSGLLRPYEESHVLCRARMTLRLFKADLLRVPCSKCLLLFHFLRLVVVALGYLAGALGHWSHDVSLCFNFRATYQVPAAFPATSRLLISSLSGCLRLPGYVRGMAILLGSPRRSRRGGTVACESLLSL